MKGKILFATGMAVGYVLGSKAGRKRYDQIKAAADKFWGDPRVHERVVQVEEFVKDKAPDVADLVAEGAKKVAGQVSSLKDKQAAKKSNGSAASKGGTASSSPTEGSTITSKPAPVIPSGTSQSIPPSPDLSIPPSAGNPG
ncbi:YtxH domain-containing protein [Salinibacterium sp. ZJ454]|uniref:YtxH domain-containing protein n=1 Tax=Salinibacterium sp. ZJ454 TaxID=2708339 RepID=UPI001AB04352|nr:YtxH domain-containing protein [Salinibacterium sp. ZJ454]